MVAAARRVEDDCSIKGWGDPFHTRLCLPIPQLQVTAPLLIPLSIQVDQDVETPPQMHSLVEIEVRMNSQQSPALDFVQSAAAEMRVGNQAFDACEFLEKRHEEAGIQRSEYAARERSEHRFVLG